MRETILQLDYLAKHFGHSEEDVNRVIKFLIKLVQLDSRIKMPYCYSMIKTGNLMLEWVLEYGSLEIHFDDNLNCVFKDENNHTTSGELLLVEQAVKMIKQVYENNSI